MRERRRRNKSQIDFVLKFMKKKGMNKSKINEEVKPSKSSLYIWILTIPIIFAIAFIYSFYLFIKTTGVLSFGIFIAFVIITALYLIIFYQKKKYLQQYYPNDKISSYLKRINIFVLIAFLLIFIFTFIGNLYLAFEFQSVPKKLKFDINENKQLSNLNIGDANCVKPHEVLVVGDRWICTLDYDITNSEYSLKKIIVSRKDIEELDFKEIVAFDLTNKEKGYFEIPLAKSGRNYFRISAELANESSYEIVNMKDFDVDVLTLELYNDWNRSRIIFFVGLISVALFSIFSAMRDLRELMKPYDK